MDLQQPFLPEPENLPGAPAATKRAGAKVLLLWVVLIVMFLTIWQFLAPPERPANAPARGQPVATCEGCESPLSVSWLPSLLTMALVGVIFVVALRRPIKFQAGFMLAQERARMMMAQRSYAAAAAEYVALLPKYSTQPGFQALLNLSLAEAQLRAGRLEDAIGSCAKVERSFGLTFTTGTRTHVAAMTTLASALRGDLPTAKRWSAETRVRLVKNKDDRIAEGAWLRLADAVIACRESRFEEATSSLDQTWNELTFALSGSAMRIVEVVRAFAEAQGGVRASNTVAERLVRLEPHVPGELAFLGVEWPEMKTFLAAHGLAT